MKRTWAAVITKRTMVQLTEASDEAAIPKGAETQF
jgi:hypothetical protein